MKTDRCRALTGDWFVENEERGVGGTAPAPGRIPVKQTETPPLPTDLGDPLSWEMKVSNRATATCPAESAFDDPWTVVQLKIARRADEYARSQPNRKMLNLHCWLLAEAELLGQDLADLRGLPTNALTPVA